jgi:hypothetical protein
MNLFNLLSSSQVASLVQKFLHDFSSPLSACSLLCDLDAHLGSQLELTESINHGVSYMVRLHRLLQILFSKEIAVSKEEVLSFIKSYCWAFNEDFAFLSHHAILVYLSCFFIYENCYYSPYSNVELLFKDRVFVIKFHFALKQINNINDSSLNFANPTNVLLFLLKKIAEREGFIVNIEDHLLSFHPFFYEEAKR